MAFGIGNEKALATANGCFGRIVRKLDNGGSGVAREEHILRVARHPPEVSGHLKKRRW
jgi:hypothetical protein